MGPACLDLPKEIVYVKVVRKYEAKDNVAYLDSTRPSGLAAPTSAFCASCQAESPG